MVEFRIEHSVFFILKNYRKEIIAENYREKIIDVATDLIGKPSVRYRRSNPELGQSPETGFDCSGFVTFVLTAAGLTVPDYIGQDTVRRSVRHVNEYWDYYGISIHEGLQGMGDLVFFSRRGRFLTHIGIMLDVETYIHAPGIDGSLVEVTKLEWQDIFPEDGAQVSFTRNPVGFKSPAIPLEQPTPRYHQRSI